MTQILEEKFDSLFVSEVLLINRSMYANEPAKLITWFYPDCQNLNNFAVCGEYAKLKSGENICSFIELEQNNKEMRVHIERSV